MKRTLLWGALCALAVTSAWGADLAQVREKGVLRVAVYKDFPPYSYAENGRYTGLDVELARALAERLGVALALEPITASDESVQDDLRNGVWKGHYLGWGGADVMLHVPVDPALQAEVRQVALFGPYYREHLAVARRTDALPTLDSLDAFRHTRVGVEFRTLGDQLLLSAAGGAYIPQVVHFRSATQACAAFRAGEVPALLAQRGEIEQCVGTVRDGIAVAPLPAAQAERLGWDVGMAVKADDEALRGALAEALAGLRRDGTLAAVLARYHLGAELIASAGGG